MKTYLFLDEVQEIKGWEKVVNSLASDFDVGLYVTGSNSRMMSSEISTYLTGRYVSFRVFTLSFGEYLMFKSQYTEIGEPKAELANYVRLGFAAEDISSMLVNPAAARSTLWLSGKRKALCAGDAGAPLFENGKTGIRPFAGDS